MWLLVAFIAVPLIEIGLFIQVGGMIGLWPTLAIVLLTALLGSWLVKGQGLRELQKLRSSFQSLNDPTEPLAHGAMILFAGALLLTPGFMTDATGFALLIPAVRNWVMREVRKRIKIVSFEQPSAARPTYQADIVEGKYEHVTPPAGPSRRGSGWTRDEH